VIAHVGALPLEEVLPVLTGAGSGLLAVRAWIAPRLRRRRGVRAVNYPTTVQMERTYSALAPGPCSTRGPIAWGDPGGTSVNSTQPA
jgi:hypothetical protein